MDQIFLKTLFIKIEEEDFEVSIMSLMRKGRIYATRLLLNNRKQFVLVCFFDKGICMNTVKVKIT